ncbi:MAG: hypothetical protein ACRC9R_04755, partial [Enterovibrio sp.]
MHPNRPAGSPPTPNTTTATVTTTQATTTQAGAAQAMNVTGVQNAAQQPATAAPAGAQDPAPPPPLPAALQQAALRQALMAHQQVPAARSAPEVIPRGRIALIPPGITTVQHFLNNVSGLQLATDTAQAGAEQRVRTFRRATNLNYSLAMQLSFSNAEVSRTTGPQKFLLEQINQAIEPYIRLRLLAMAFLRFYDSADINQSVCAELFNASKSTVSGWKNDTYNFHQTGNITNQGISSFIRRMQKELHERGLTHTIITTTATHT